MTRHHVEITPDWPPGKGVVKVDGHDITRAVRRFHVDAWAGEPPVIDIDLGVGVIELNRIDAEEAEVIITEPTRDALIALGWRMLSEVEDRVRARRSTR